MKPFTRLDSSTYHAHPTYSCSHQSARKRALNPVQQASTGAMPSANARRGLTGVNTAPVSRARRPTLPAAHRGTPSSPIEFITHRGWTSTCGGEGWAHSAHACAGVGRGRRPRLRPAITRRRCCGRVTGSPCFYSAPAPPRRSQTSPAPGGDAGAEHAAAAGLCPCTGARCRAERCGVVCQAPPGWGGAQDTGLPSCGRGSPARAHALGAPIVACGDGRAFRLVSYST
jgi:hypothetical protein